MAEEEFPIEKIMDHKLFVDLLEEARQGKAQFNPSSVESGSCIHSKYAYLVHWLNYDLKDRTWEPEDNLLDNLELAKYKNKRALPMKHETFEKRFHPIVHREIRLAAERVDGIEHLMSRKEIRRAKEERLRRLQRMNEEQKERKEQKEKREPVPTLEDPADVQRKREKREREQERQFAIPKKRRSLEEESHSPRSSADFESENKERKMREASRKDVPSTSASSNSSTTLPGLTPLATNTPKIQKKGAGSTRTSLDEAASPDYSPIEIANQQKNAQKTTASLNKFPSVEIIEPKKGKPNPLKAELKAKILEKKASIKQYKKEIESIRQKLAKYPIEVAVSRPTRSFSTSLWLMKTRRCRSAENLNQFWVKNAELELFANNFAKLNLESSKPQCVIRKLKERKSLNGARPSKSREELLQAADKKLAEENWSRVKQMKIVKTLDKSVVKLLEQLVTAFSNDLSVHFERLVNERLTEPTFDALRYIAIVLISTQCKHRYWEIDGTSRPLFESKSSQTWGKVRAHETVCCENHRKCTWIEVFMRLMPARMRFLETSEHEYHGIEDEDDGPFRDDIFFHCMKRGAECQKILFFKYSKPIGIQEDEVGKYSLDVMHLLAVQHGNLQRIGWYMAEGGVDINALATHTETNTVLRLQEFLKVWINENVRIEQHKIFYQRLHEMVVNTADTLEMFTENEMNKMISRRMAGRWKIQMDLTYPHILRCSPMSNRFNGGDGTHQVLSCLFYPQVIGLRDGLPETGAGPYDEEKIARLRSNLKKYQKMVSEKKGRLVLAVYRTKIGFQAKVRKNQPFSLPTFELVESNEGFNIEKMTLLRQKEGLPGEEADLNMEELTAISSPGCRYFVLSSEDVEKDLVVPGNAHIELLGEVDEPITFTAQVFFIRKKV